MDIVYPLYFEYKSEITLNKYTEMLVSSLIKGGHNKKEYDSLYRDSLLKTYYKHKKHHYKNEDTIDLENIIKNV